MEKIMRFMHVAD